MKKLFFCILALCLSFSLAACSKKTDDENQNTSDENVADSNDRHVCTYNAKCETIPATCESGGYTLYTCICGKTKEESPVDPLGHSWCEWTVDVAPTNSTAGTLKRACNNGDFETLELPILNAEDYLISVDNADSSEISCNESVPAYYTYNGEIYDDALGENRVFEFESDYLSSHKYTNRYVYSFGSHSLCCTYCGLVDMTSEETHDIEYGECTVCGYIDRKMKYSNDGNGISVSYTENEQNAVIPEFYLNSYEVSEEATVKGIKSFANNDNLISITIPATIEYISAFAFEGCTSLEAVYYDGTWEKWCSISFGANANPMNYADKFYLKSGSSYKLVSDIVLPDTVKVISGSAFEGFKSIKSLTIPRSVTTLGDNLNPVFSEGVRIGKVYYGGDFADWCNVSINALHSNPMQFTTNFYMTDSEGTYYTPTDITLPDSVSAIGNHQFTGLASLKSITATAKLKSIGDYAFQNCVSLTAFDLSLGCSEIGYYAFGGCSALLNIYLPSDVSSIDNFAFEGCIRLKSIFFKGRINDWCSIKLAGASSNPMHINRERNIESAVSFYTYLSQTNEYCKLNSQSITLGELISEIEDYQFYGFTSIVEIIIPHGVTYIGKEAFAYCKSLTTLAIPLTVTRIDKNALCESNEYIRIYYGGTASDWNKISVSTPNDKLNAATRYYYAENPDLVNSNDNFWTYNSNGNIVEWFFDSENEEWHYEKKKQ